MKTLKYLLLAVLICPAITFAKTDNEKIIDSKDDMIIGVSVSQEDLDASKNNHDEDQVLGYNSKTIATTTKYDKLGNVVYSKSIALTPKEELMLENNKNIHILEDGKLHDLSNTNSTNSVYWQYETASKKVEINYVHYTNGNYGIQLTNTWKTNPKTKSYDIIAARWTNYKTTAYYTVSGQQIPTVSEPHVDYTESASANNMVKQPYGAGISQNLYDDYVPMLNTLLITSATDFGTNVYGTYQHATSNISLANSKSYTISSTGLGGVIAHNYSSYYDGMTGVYQ